MTTWITATPSAWTKIADGADTVFITVKNNGVLQYCIETTDPDAANAFHMLTPPARTFNGSGLSARKVYVRSGTDRDLIISVDTV